MRVMTSAERETYVPPPCPICGGPGVVTSWVDALNYDDDPRDPETARWLPAMYECERHGVHPERGGASGSSA